MAKKKVFGKKIRKREGSKNIEDIRDPKAAKAHDTKETMKDKVLTDIHLPERKKATTSLQNSVSNYHRASKTNPRMTAPHKSERFFEPQTFKKPLKKGTASNG